MSRRSILILTASHLCRNPRVLKEATTLGAAGYDVMVLSIATNPQFEQIDRDLTRGQPFRRQTLDYVSRAPARRLARFLQRAATWAARRQCRYFGLESPQALGPASVLLDRALRLPAELTIVHTEIPIWAAQHLIRAGRRVGVDLEDWYSEDLLYADRRNRPLRLLRRAEQFALVHAAYASAPSASLAGALAARFGGPRPVVIRNTFPLQSESRAHAPGPNAIPRLIWFSQTIGAGRGLELFLAAWARTNQRSEVCLLGDPQPAFVRKLLSRLPAARRGDLQVLAPVPPAALPAVLAQFDIGLALEQAWPVNRDVTITNKIFQYLNAGLAIVATATSGQREVMRAAPDAGVLVEAHETTAYAAQLDALIGDRARLRAAQLAARAAAEREFCWEHDAPRLLAAVAAALR